jgi:hypothetical protein
MGKDAIVWTFTTLLHPVNEILSIKRYPYPEKKMIIGMHFKVIMHTRESTVCPKL